MGPKSFFIIVLRIMGIYFILEFISRVPVLFKEITSLFMIDVGGSVFFSGFMLFAITVLFILMLNLLVLRPYWLVDKLRLARNFEEEKFSFNIHHNTVVKIAIILIGGILLVFHLLPFLMNLYLFLKQTNEGENGVLSEDFFMGPRINFYILLADGLPSILGYYLLSNSRYFSKWIEATRRKNKTQEEETEHETGA